MRKPLMRLLRVLPFLFFLTSYAIVFPQDSTGIDMGVTLNAYVKLREVPLNRNLALNVEVYWTGDIDLVEIGDVEEPVLTNFKITGTSSSNRIMDSAGIRKAVKTIVYLLQPVNLGMAYIEPVSLSYTDKTTGKNHLLRTQRFQVEVLSPVAEPGEKGPWWPWVIFPFLLCGLAASVYFLIKRSRGEGKEEVTQSDLEQTYLEELKSEVKIDASDRNEAIGVLTRLFRQYLADKYSIPALEATTGELLRQIEKTDLDDSVKLRCETLFKKSDVIRFSGHEATPAELSEAYTTVESILESNLRVTREARLELESAGVKKRSLRKKKQ